MPRYSWYSARLLTTAASSIAPASIGPPRMRAISTMEMNPPPAVVDQSA